VRLVAIVDMATGLEADGRRYEDEVLLLLDRHGGTLESRLHSTDGTTEVQTISFSGREGFESFLADPDRAALRERFGAAAPTTRVVFVNPA
jgi:hypothetical protein